MRRHALLLATVVNVACFLAIAGSFLLRGAKLATPWDGPTLVTVLLATATLVLGAVAIGVGLLAIWGYTTLREHAGNVATKAASETAEQVATRAFQAWMDRVSLPAGSIDAASSGGESVVDAYRGKEP